MKVADKKKNAITIICIILAICILGSTAVALGYSVQSIIRGYPTKITSSFVMFTLNGNNYLNGIQSENMNISKGEQVDLTVEVGIETNASAYVSYRLYFEVDNDGDVDAFNAVADAVEVYLFNGSKYEYLCQLSHLGDKTGGEPVHFYQGELCTDYTQNVNYRLVYSPETSAEYDNLAKDGKFTLRAFADELDFSSTKTQKYIYVSDSEVFQTCFEDESSVGKTIILNGDITLTKNITSKGKVSVNLNGHKLNTNGKNLTVVSGDTETEENFNVSVLRGMRMAIIDGEETPVQGEIIGGGKFILPTELCFVDSAFTSNIVIAFTEDILQSFAKEVSARLKQLDGGKLYNYGEDVSFLFEGMEYLIKDVDGVEVYSDGHISLSYDSHYTQDGFVKISYQGGIFVLDDQDVASNDITTRYNVLLTFAGVRQIATASGLVTLQGQSAYAIAKTLGDQLPEVIDSSYLLKSYDRVTAAMVQWRVDDGVGGLLFNNGGIYRSEGARSLKAALDAKNENYYENKPLEIYVTVSKGTNTATYAVSGVTVKPFSAAELTSFIYDDVAITVGADIPYLFANRICTDADWFGLVGFSSVGVSLTEDADKYLNSTTEGDYVKLTTKPSVDTNFVGKTKLNVTFNYQNGESYTREYEVNLVGEAKYITSYDVSATLQAHFNSNPYVEGEGYEFTAKTVLMPSVSTMEGLKQIPVFVDYEVRSEAAKNFISVTYDFVEVDPDDMDDFYAYFVYDEASGCYLLAEKDEDGNYIGSVFYERLAVIEILPARVIFSDVTSVIVNAVLYTMDHSDENTTHYAEGTVDHKSVKGTPYKITDNGVEVNAYYDLASETTTYLSYPLSLEVDGVITNTADGVPDYNLYAYLLELYDGVKNGVDDGILTIKEAGATWEEILLNLERKGKRDLVVTTEDVRGYFGNSYFTGNTYIKKYFPEVAGSNYVSLEDFIAASQKGSASQTVGNYATFHESSTMADSSSPEKYGVYVLKATQAHLTSAHVQSNSWGKLKYENGEVISVTAANSLGNMWDYIKISLDSNGMPVYPDDYSTGDYLPGVYLVYFRNNGTATDPATQADKGITYNRYFRTTDGSYYHYDPASPPPSGTKYYNNPSIVGPFNYMQQKSRTYLDLNNVSISSLDGIGYFTNLQGLSFKNSGISDLSPLSELLHLTYLDISAEQAGVNIVTNLLPLKYLDSLQYLDLTYTNVTTLEDIRYLKSLEELNISNTSVEDFVALTDMPSLQNLTLTDMGLTNNNAKMYNLAIVSLNTNGEFVVLNNKSLVNIDQMAIVAASVMHEVENFNRVNKILYLPLNYNYGGEEYKLRWFSSDTNLININNDTGGTYASCTIIHPLFDTDLELYVQVLKEDGNYFRARRVFNVTLEAGVQDTKYIFFNGDYVNIDLLVPDLILRNLIFTTFNSADESSVMVNGTAVSNKYVITEQELKDYRALSITLNWADKGITDLTGIECLAPLFAQDKLYMEFNLSNNDISDLTPLTSLQLNVLILGGKEYDLSQLLAKDGSDNPLLTSLYALDVHECVNVSTESSLENLYKIYTNNNNVYIYKDKAPETTYFNDSASAWNPYSELVEKALREKQSVFTFVSQNETVNVFGTGSSFTFDIYDREITFNYSNNQLFQANTYFTFDAGNKTVKYANMNAWEEAAILRIELAADDGHKGWDMTAPSTNNEVTYTQLATSIKHDWYVELITLDPGAKINVYCNGRWQPISDLFASYDIALEVYKWFYGTTGYGRRDRVYSLDALNEKSYYKDDATGAYYVKAEMISEYFSVSNNTIKMVGRRISGEELTYGLELLPSVKKLTFDRDMALGNGEHIVNVTNITANSSGVDFASINTDIALQTFQVKGFSSFSATRESMEHFVDLEKLDLSYSEGTNQGEQITDWSFLLGLIHESEEEVGGVLQTVKKSKLKSLWIYNQTTTTGAQTMLQQITPQNWQYVYELYCASVANGNIPDFKLYEGTTRTSSASRAIALNESGQLTCGGTPVYTPSGVTISDKLTLDTALTYTEEEGYNIVVANMTDMGLKVNGTYWHELEVADKYAVSKNTLLTLPDTTYYDWFGIQFDEAGTKTRRSYNIAWKLYFTTGGNVFTTTDITSSTYTLADDGYAVVVGTVSYPGETSYSFMYHFVVGGGDGLYSNVTDRTLRAYLFATCANISGISGYSLATISQTSKISDAKIYEILDARGLASAKLEKDTTSNYVHSLAGFGAVINAAGKNGEITSINFSNQKMLAIDELNGLTNLNTLILDNTDVNLANFVTPNSLTEFSIKNDASFGLSDLQILVASGNVNNLNIYNTGVSALYEVLPELLNLSANSITLAWKEETATAVTKTQIQTFKNVLDANVFDTSGFALADFASAQIIDGVTFSLPTDIYNLLLQYDIAPEVDTVLEALYNDNNQLFVYRMGKCVKAGANTGYIGLGTTDVASNYDTAMLAYLVANGYLTINGEHLLKIGMASCNISTNIGIKDVTNNVVDGVTVHVSHNSLIGAATQPNATAADAPSGFSFSDVLDVTNTNPQVNIVGGVVKTIPATITYSTNEYTVSVTIPRYVFINGKSYTVDVTPAVGNVGTFSFVNGVIKFVFADTLILNTEYECGYTVTLTSAYGSYFEDATFKITRLQSDDTVEELDQANFLVEVQYDEATNTVYMVDDYGQRTVSAKATPSVLYIKNGRYYYSAVSGYTSTVYYVPATTFFKSGRLRTYLYWIGEFNGGSNTYYKPFSDGSGGVTGGTLFEKVLKDDSVGSKKYGKILLNEYALKLVDLRLAMTEGFGITSLEGVQMFANTQSIYLLHNAFTDITPLENMHLKSFQWVNSKPGDNFMTADFTPLIKGSSETLEIFGYNGYGNVNATDLSFLTGCPNLQRVYFGTRSVYNSTAPITNGDGFTYLKTLPFQYVLASLYNRGVYVYISDDTTLIKGGLLTLDKTNSYNWVEYHASDKTLRADDSVQTFLSLTLKKTLYAIVPTSGDMQAANVLDNLGNALSPNGHNVYSELGYGYLFTAKQYTEVTGSASVTLYLPATINYNGEISLAMWKGITGNVKDIVYVKQDVGGIETEMTIEEMKTYISSIEYYNAQKAGRVQVYAKLTVDVGDLDNISACDYTRLTCSIEIDGTYYQRLITLKFED